MQSNIEKHVHHITKKDNYKKEELFSLLMGNMRKQRLSSLKKRKQEIWRLDVELKYLYHKKIQIEVNFLCFQFGKVKIRIKF